jgi:hypothetical protein
MGIRRVRWSLAAAAAALVVAACGSGHSTTTHSSTTAASQPTTTSTTTTAASSSTAAPATTTSTGTAGPAPRARTASAACAPGQVSVSLGPGSAGLGHAGFALLFTNTGSGSCALTGYPGAALVAEGGAQLQVQRTPNGYLGGLAPGAKANPIVRLAPRQVASALLEGLDSTSAGGPCPQYAALLVTPPNSTVTSRLTRTMSICRPQIHPVVPGRSGEQH